MKELIVTVKVDVVSKDGNLIIKKACDGVENTFREFYGVKVRAQRSMSRIYKRDVRNLGTVKQYTANNLFYGAHVVNQNHTLVKVSISFTDREVNRWKLKNFNVCQDVMSGKYERELFCNVGA